MDKTIPQKQERGFRLAYGGKVYNSLRFACQREAEDFIQWIGDRTGLDPRHQSDQRLQELYVIWTGTH